MGALKNPDASELTELRRHIGSNPVLRNYFQSCLDAKKDSLVNAPDVNAIRVAQGQAQMLTELLKFISL